MLHCVWEPALHLPVAPIATCIFPDVVCNIVDESILQAVKARLLNPLLPLKYRPTTSPRLKEERKSKVLDEFDPLPPYVAAGNPKALRSVKEYQEEILSLFANKEQKTD